MEEKKCNKCKKKLPFSNFHKNKHNVANNGREYTCRQCKSIYRKKLDKNGIPWREKNKEYARNSYYKRHYNITLEQYDQMFEDQDGVCAICCSINADGRRLAVDHNHKTNQVRELLCLKCNALVGSIETFGDLLTKAIGYLRKHNDI